MFKRTLAMLAGAALLTTAAATESRAVGLEDIGTTLILETGDPLVTVLATDPLDPTSTTDGAAAPFGDFFAGGTSEDGDLVSMFANDSGTSTIGIFDDSVPAFILSGAEEDLDYTNNDSGEDLIEILFSVTGGSLSSAPFVLASITGEFGSDPFNTGTDPITGLPLSTVAFATPAKITLTNVSQIPLPAGMVLLLTALGGLILVRRRAA